MVQRDCAFCDIARGAADAEMVFESPDFVAFFPLDPATAGHTLIIPREHAVDVWSLTPSLVGPLFETTVAVGAAIRTALRPEGMNIIHSAGRAATQTVFHLHVHLVPRWSSDDVKDFWPAPSASPADWKQDAALQEIRARLG